MSAVINQSGLVRGIGLCIMMGNAVVHMVITMR